tara:strand:+ start:1957 stop:2181 length:225 start_codon:yes stop_codon:yes gene_type:complete
MNKVNTRVMRAIRNSKGRFFGLYTFKGESLNAQLMKETDSYVQVYDRNSGKSRTFAKTSVCGVRIAEKNFGKVF